MSPIYLASVWLHLIAASVWLGGMVFLVAVVLRTARRTEFAPHKAALTHWVGLYFRTLGWISLVLLIVTGIVNLGYRGFAWQDLWAGTLFAGVFGQRLAWKLALVAAVLMLSGLHDFWIGLRATEAMQNGESGAERWRRLAAWMGRINLLLSLAIFWLAAMLVRGA